jgi:hypothetical protein
MLVTPVNAVSPSLAGSFVRSPAHEQSVEIAPKLQENRLPGRCQSSLSLRSGQQYSHPHSSPLGNEFFALPTLASDRD